jgi:hypothetical protein
MENTAYCSVCEVVVPIIRQAAGKAIGVTLGSLAGGLGTKSPVGALAVGLIGLALGHLVDEELDAICGQCGATVRVGPATWRRT